MNPALPEILAQALAAAGPAAICVAFSGGPDSTALLHALATLPDVRARGLRALHVDHGLNAASAGWARHCAVFCAQLAVPLTAIRVQVDTTRGEGVEAAARHARYAAFARQLHADEYLALAHHRDDQIETVLLKLLRGAGPEGLGGMRALRPFANGVLWRPLLATPRKVLQDYLAVQNLPSISDPANDDPRFARNALRHELLPALTRRWPGAGAAILHAARRCRDAADYIEDSAAAEVRRLQRNDGALDVHGWLALAPTLRASVLDRWLYARQFSTPPDHARVEIVRQATQAARDRVPRVTWPGAEVRIWNARLYALPQLGPIPPAWSAEWDGSPLALPPDCGTLQLIAPDGSAGSPRFTTPLRVSLRRGGERMRPAGNACTREVRDLFQSARLPPWLRDRCPFIWHGDELVAVADLFTTTGGRELLAAHDTALCWRRPTWAALQQPSPPNGPAP